MAILFQNKKKTTFYIILVIFIVVVIGLAFFLINKIDIADIDEIVEEVVVKRQEDVKIDFSTIENQLLEGLEPFNPIVPTKEGYGRDNPFESKVEE